MKTVEEIILKHALRHIVSACNRIETLSDTKPEKDAIQEIALEALELQTKILNYLEHLKCLEKETRLLGMTRP